MLGQFKMAAALADQVRADDLVVLGVGHEGVRQPLVAERTGRAMAGDKCDVPAKRPELLRDRIDQILMIASREIRPAD